jgi:hypothetical protein
MVLHQRDCIFFARKAILIVFKHSNADMLVVSLLPSNNTYYETNVQQQARPECPLRPYTKEYFHCFP